MDSSLQLGRVHSSSIVFYINKELPAFYHLLQTGKVKSRAQHEVFDRLNITIEEKPQLSYD